MEVLCSLVAQTFLGSQSGQQVEKDHWKMIDIHTHILPEIDDGAESLDEAYEMALMAVRSGVKALVATALKVKPIMGATPEGTIYQLDKARGINKALLRMVEHIVKKTVESEKKVLGISHCNCPERAIFLKNALEEKLKVRRVVILDTAGVSSMYANDGGVIVVV